MVCHKMHNEVFSPGKSCAYPGCGKSCYVEADGTIHDYCCKSHATAVHPQPVPIVQPNAPVPFAPVVPGAPTNTCKWHTVNNKLYVTVTNFAVAAGGVAMCAIPECNNPCFVDEQGKVFECCGYTHAMELQRRKALATGHYHIYIVVISV